MIHYPYLKEQPSTRQVTDTFKGYNHNLRIGSGEFSEMENLTSDDFPVLSTRKKRGRYLYSLQDGGIATGMLYVPGTGLFITIDQQDPQDHDGREIGALYLLGEDGNTTSVADPLLPGHKSLALMGKKLIVAPDMIEVDTDTLKNGKIELALEVNGGILYFQMCREDGTFYHPLTASEVSPDNPVDGDYWLELHGKDKSLRQYSATQESWTIISSTYTKIWGSGLYGHSFCINDAVTISGVGIKDGSTTDIDLSALNGQCIICSVDRDSIVVNASFMGSGAVDCNNGCNIQIIRTVPKLNFIVEAGNRLWGCAQDTNEIYACKLGDINNWNCFQGLSTDSWVGSVGTPGEFTGAAVQNGYPVFYKETCKHKIWPSATGAHQMTTVNCNGVEIGSESSLAVCDDTVFYKSARGVFADDGGRAVEIGQALGNIRYRNGVGAIHDRKYYLSMEDSTGKRGLFVYDIARKMWHRENSIRGVLCSAWDSLFAAYGDIWDLTGNTGTPEEKVSWMAVTGDLGLELPEQKYISRLTLRLMLEPGATLEVYAQYDREQTWVKLGKLYGTDLRSFSLPVRPRRCGQLRLKLQGKGMCKLYSITKTLEKGSELP